MGIYYQDDLVTVLHGDCIEEMRSLPDDSVHAVVTDPPYGLGFMGREWDALPPGLDFAVEALRVLKPGGHILAFGGSRTWHRLAVAIEDAGFELRDSIAWLYGSGFPKSLDVSKAIDKAAGAERELTGDRGRTQCEYLDRGELCSGHNDAGQSMSGATIHSLPTKPATDDAQTWQGWGTALKPAFEPIVVGRKPLVGTVAQNVLAHGTGALNIDACRIAGEHVTTGNGTRNTIYGDLSANGGQPWESHVGGRWPSNVVLDEGQAEALDKQSGMSASIQSVRGAGKNNTATFGAYGTSDAPRGHNDSGGASRFFPTFGREGEASAEKRYTDEGATDFAPTPGTRREAVAKSEMFPTFHYEAKAPGSERPDVDGVQHPTVKPLDLMRWLVRLVTPPGGTVLDPFVGSGTTLEAALIEGFHSIGIEREETYLPLIMQRITKPLQQSLDFGEETL